MFDATENFWILPNVILRMLPVVKSVSFELNFWHESKCNMSSFAGQEWSNSLFQAKFSTRLKISGFCQISSFAGLEWSKIYFLSQIFNTNQNFSRFCQISSFAGSEWSALSFFSQICSVTENFWILPNFILCMSRLVKNVSCELNFWHESKFLDFPKFHPLQVRSGQNLDCKPNFQRDWKYLDFAIFHPSQVWSGQKSDFWAKFSTQIKIFLDFVKILSFAGSEWVTLSFLSQIFNTTENFWIVPNFIFCMSRVVELLILGLILIAIENLWILPHFILCMSRLVSQKCLFLAKFSTRLKISWFCKISSFAGQN